ncbi:MAG: hypothetical protein Q4F41_14390 [Eubacteriales bacterium]|nr:hypothetical protein [Eubacteriales bacterium]
MYIKEIASSLYPWDLADRTVEKCVNDVVEHAGVNSVYLVGIMHKEKRPLTSLFYTLNPVRKYYLPEDSRVYYRMDEANFRNTRMKPIYSDRDFLKNQDWLDNLTTYARKLNLKTGIEISHTLFDVAYAEREFPDVFQQDITGQRIPMFYCSNHPDVREYLKAIFYDSVKNHDVDFIQTCMMVFNEGKPVAPPWFLKEKDPQNRIGHLLGALTGGCFCENCRKKALSWGYDWDKIVFDLKELHKLCIAVTHGANERVMEQHLLLGSDLTETGFLLENPSLYQWLEFRVRCITELFQEIHREVKRANPKAELRYNNYLTYPELAGIDFSRLGPYLDSVRDSDYSEHFGAPDHFRKKQNNILKIRRGIGFEKPILGALSTRPNSTPELLMEAINVFSTLGIDGLSLGHYDGATYALLDSIKEGMRRSGIELVN